MTRYAERYVAFLDILGFRDLISRSVESTPSISVDQIRSVLDMSDPAGEDKIILGRIGDISRSGHRMMAFSDSVIISTDATEQGIIHLLHHVGTIGFKLIRLRALCRGGITRGPVFHDERHCFGPAVLDAIDLEKAAAMPRVVLSDKVIEDGRSLVEPVRTAFRRLTHSHGDEVVFVHYLGVLRMIADCDKPPPNDIRALQAEIKEYIANEFKRLENRPEEKRKIEWFQSYFDWAVDDSWRSTLMEEFPRRLEIE